MKTELKHSFIALALLSVLTLGFQLPAIAQATVFTYQGHITDNGTNFTGSGQFKFALVTSTNFNQQATATVNLGGVSPNYFVSSCTVNNGGSGYASIPAVTISGGGGSGATAAASLGGSAVNAVNVLTPGSGYTNLPTITIAPPPANISYVTYWSNDGTSSAGSEPNAAVSVNVSNGLFTVVLGDTTVANMMAINASLFSQPNLQLRIWFNDGVNGFAALSPLQNLTPTPYAIQAVNANSASNLLGTLPASQLSGTLPPAQLPVTVLTNNANGVSLNGTFSGDGSGLYNTVTTENYISAYGTMSQFVDQANTFQAATFQASFPNGWTLTSQENFTCNQTGIYLVQYNAEVGTTMSSATTISLIVTFNGNEIPNSQSSATLAVANQPVVVSKSFLVNAASGAVFQVQFSGSNAYAELVAGNGAGNTKPSISMTIVRIQ
jgi:hypothetical protein